MTFTPARPLTLSEIEGNALLPILNLPIDISDPRWAEVEQEDGALQASSVGVAIKRISAPGCPVWFVVTAPEDHVVWSVVAGTRILMSRSVRVQSGVLEIDDYAHQVAKWAARQRGPVDHTAATYMAYGYMLGFPVADDEPGDCPVALIGTVLADAVSRPFDVTVQV